MSTNLGEQYNDALGTLQIKDVTWAVGFMNLCIASINYNFNLITLRTNTKSVILAPHKTNLGNKQRIVISLS